MEYHVKVMEEACSEVLLQNYSSFKNLGMGQSIESEAIEVGGHSFTLRFYPQGKDQLDHVDNRMSLCIKNQSAESVELAFAFEFMNQYPFPFPARSPFGRCSQFHDRGIYRRVTTLGPGLEGGGRFSRCLFDMPMTYVRRDSIRINATIGVFVRKPLETVCDPTIFFRAGSKRFFAEESVLRIRCPALLWPNDVRFTDDDVVLDVDPDVFDAVLWFIYNGKLARRDRQVISEARYMSYADRINADRFTRKMVAAAHRFELESLRRSIVYAVDPILNVHSFFCLPIGCALQKLWEHFRRGILPIYKLMWYFTN